MTVIDASTMRLQIRSIRKIERQFNLFTSCILAETVCNQFHKFRGTPLHKHTYHVCSFSNRSLSTGRQKIIDPTAKTPNKKCDPYGLDGKPLALNEAKQQLSLLDQGWKISGNEENGIIQPMYIHKEFCHRNYLDGSKFISKLAAVAHNNNHFFSMKLERRLMRMEKKWKIITTIRCHTEVLGGLSFHDFHIAMLIDVEVARDDVIELVLPLEKEIIDANETSRD